MFPFSNYGATRVHLPNQGGSPGIRIFSCKDLQHWTPGKWLVKSSRLPMNCPYKDRFWAPEIHKIAGRYYLIFTADNWVKNSYNPAGKVGAAGYAFVGVTDHVDGPYRHITYIKHGPCDTTLFAAPDGKTYAVMPAGNMFEQQIDLRGIDHGEVHLVGVRKEIVTADNTAIHKPSPNYLEGPWVVRDGSHYTLFYAELYHNKTVPYGYFTGAAYANSPMGPWKKDPRGKILEGGHLAVFDGPGHVHWFSYRDEAPNRGRGRLCIDPCLFNSDGTAIKMPSTIGPAMYPPKSP